MPMECLEFTFIGPAFIRMEHVYHVELVRHLYETFFYGYSCFSVTLLRQQVFPSHYVQ